MADWTDERIKVLTQMWTEGYSCSQIAAHLGGVTRNAVIGKRVRLGLPSREQDARYKGASRRQKYYPQRAKAVLMPLHVQALKAMEKKMKAAVPKAEPKTKPVGEPAPLNLELLDLTDQNCRWPVNDGGPFLFCGHDRAHGSSYCEFHDDVSRNGYPKQKFSEAA